MIVLDGSRGEGGGQILRTALALSMVTGTPFAIERIRARRPRPGLKAQHLAAIRAISALAGAEPPAAVLGQETLTFTPLPLRARRLEIDVGTAGSLSLLLQSLLPPLALRGDTTSVTLIGGTDVAWSPPVDYTSGVLLPSLASCGSFRLRLLKRGYHPRGGGRIELTVGPPGTEPPSLGLSGRGPLTGIGGVSHASGDLAGAMVAERQARAAAEVLGPLGAPLEVRREYGPSLSRGSGITLWATFAPPDTSPGGPPRILGADALGARGKRAESVGGEAAERLLEEIGSGAAVDMHLADQLVPWIALYGGELRTSRISGHTLSNAYVAETFLGNPVSIDERLRTVSARKRGALPASLSTPRRA